MSNTEDLEAKWQEGWRAAHRKIIAESCKAIGYDDPLAAAAAVLAQRDETIAALREVCGEYGRNDWSDDLHMADIVRKNLHRQLRRNYEALEPVEPKLAEQSEG